MASPPTHGVVGVATFNPPLLRVLQPCRVTTLDRPTIAFESVLNPSLPPAKLPPPTPVARRGKGRSPWRTEAGAVILITDGNNATAGVTADNGMAMAMGMGMPTAASMLSMEAIGQGASGAVGGELCGKPYRWDQRLFTVILGGAGGGGKGGAGMGVGRADGGGVPAETVMALRVSEVVQFRDGGTMFFLFGVEKRCLGPRLSHASKGWLERTYGWLHVVVCPDLSRIH